jgi:hypothetical protein
VDDLVHRSGGSEVVLNESSRLVFTGHDYRLNDKSAKAMEEATLAVQSLISNFYVRRTEGMPPSSKPKDWRMEVVDAQGHKRKDITLAYPQSPPSCPKLSAP